MSYVATIGANPIYTGISAGGQLSYPLQPCFFLYLPTTVVNATGNGNLWALGTTTNLTKLYDQNNNCTLGGENTAPVSGIFLMHGQITISVITALMTDAYLQITSTSNTYQSAFTNPVKTSGVDSGYCTMNIVAHVPLAAGNTITFAVNVSGGLKTVSVVGSASSFKSWFSGHMVA